jgi:cell division protein FtsW (lipid II flippase)
MMMGASLVQAVTRGSLYGLIGVGLALALIGWGALTRVRRRLFGGAIAFGVSLLLLIVVPLAPAVPHLGGAAVWLALAGAGVVAIFAAALLDVTRAAARRGVAKFADLTRDWE